MAQVNMELSELDTLRKRASDAEQAESELKSRINELENSHKAEIEEYKKGGKVIIRHPNVTYSNLTISPESLASEILYGIQRNNRGCNINEALKNYTIDIIKNRIVDMYNTGIGNKEIFREDIESVVNFNEIESEVKTYYYNLYADIISKYNTFVKTKKEIVKDYKIKLSESQDSILNKSLKDLEDQREHYQKIIDDIKEKHEKHIEHLKSTEQKLDDVLANLGFTTKKTLFGTILTPIKNEN